ncbi:MAG: hypothetical protein AAFQ64_06210 [Pseudomonadota bacterium]
MRHAVLLVITFALGLVLLYLSRFWFLDLWPRSGLFGIEEIRPGGDLIRRWLRGTSFAPFELILWAVGVFVVLTWIQKLYDLLVPPPQVKNDKTEDS